MTIEQRIEVCRRIIARHDIDSPNRLLATRLLWMYRCGYPYGWCS